MRFVQNHQQQQQQNTPLRDENLQSKQTRYNYEYFSVTLCEATFSTMTVSCLRRKITKNHVHGTYMPSSLSGSVHFKTILDGVYALGKVHMRSTPPLGSFPNVAFETVPVFV